MPAAFISRATRFSLQEKPASIRSRTTRGEPYVPSLAWWLCLIALRELGILTYMCAWAPAEPVVKATARYANQTTHRSGWPDGPISGDEAVLHLRSAAKQPSAFFNMSRSVLTFASWCRMRSYSWGDTFSHPTATSTLKLASHHGPSILAPKPRSRAIAALLAPGRPITLTASGLSSSESNRLSRAM